MHAVNHALVIRDREDRRRFYLGPGRDGNLLEVVTVTRANGSEFAIHAMKVRRKYHGLLEGR